MPETIMTRFEVYESRFGSASPSSQSQCFTCRNRFYDHSFFGKCPNETEEHFLKFLKGLLPVPDIMLGADPEFEVRDSNGRIINASNVRALSSRTSGELGLDGASVVGEIRPGPGSPAVVLENISKILDTANRAMTSYGIYGGAGKTYPIGGHIHFSGTPVHPNLLTLLDKYIASPLREISRQRIRNEHGYGGLGEYRSQPHGWEYRAPCSWISHPTIAAGVLEVAHKCALANSKKISIDTQEKLLEFAGSCSELSKKAIGKFFNALEVFKKNGVSLEEVEIFQAWKKRGSARAAETINVVNFSFSEDYKLSEIYALFNAKRMYKLPENVTNIDIRVVGASAERTRYGQHDFVIFVDSRLKALLPQHTICGATVMEWDKVGTMALGYTLRKENYLKCVEILRYIRWYIAHHSRAAIADKVTTVLKEIE